VHISNRMMNKEVRKTGERRGDHACKVAKWKVKKILRVTIMVTKRMYKQKIVKNILTAVIS